MKNSRMMKRMVLFVCLCMIVTMPSFAIGFEFEATAQSDLSMQLVQRPGVDVVLTVGNSGQDISEFEADLLARLEELNIDPESVNIQAIETTTVSTNGVGAKAIFDSWYNYPNSNGGWLYNVSTKSVGSKVNTSWTGFWKDEVTEGITMECDLGQLDALNGDWVDNDSMGLTFRMNYGGNVDYKQAKEDGYVANTNLSDYSYYVYVTDGGGYISPGLYKNIKGQSNQGIMLAPDNWIRKDGKWYSIKIEVNGANIVVYKKDTATGEYVEQINYTDPDPLPAGGYGVFTSSQANGNFKNFSIVSESFKRFSEVIREPSWRDSAERFVVNVDDKLIGDFEDKMTLSEILYRTLNEDIHYIGWGNNENQSQANAFIADNNSMGTFVNRDQTSYTDAIDHIATYIAGKVEAKTKTSGPFDPNNPQAVGNFIAGQPVSIEVDPSDLKSNTVTTEYPNGRWRVNQNPSFYANPMGTMWWDNSDQDDLPEAYTKPGAYDFYFEDTLVSMMNFHRQPVADFSYNPATNVITDKSYDLDSPDLDENGYGDVVVHAWKWKEVTAASSTEVSDRAWIFTEPKPENFLAGKEYIVQLRVLDAQGSWSRTTSKYISTTVTTPTTVSVPIADFSMSTDYLQKHLETSVILTDKSYDPKGASITAWDWTVSGPDGRVSYNTENVTLDFTTATQGDYTIQLLVTNSEGTDSKIYTKSLTVVDDLINPTVRVDSAEGSTLLNPFEVTLNFADEGGSGFKRQLVTLVNTTTEETTSLGWSSAKEKTVTLDKDGIWNLVVAAEDQKGNTTNVTYRGYTVDATAPSTPVITGDPNGWTVNNVTVTISGSVDASAITYKYAISAETPNDGDWVTGTSKSMTSTGAFHIWARAIDAVGNVSDTADTWVYIDKTAPVFTSVPTGRSMNIYDPYSQDIATANDPESGLNGGVTANADAVKTGVIGRYPVIYSATNMVGLTTTDLQYITVEDQKKPVLALKGQSSVDVEVNTSYADAGATATDNYEADALISGKIVASNNINLGKVGPYTVTYNVSDASGNAALPITRTVEVVDTTIPVLSLKGQLSVDVEVHTSYTDAGASATDNYDDDTAISATITSTNDINLDKVGPYTVTYGVTDINGNAAKPITRTVNVVDTTVPVIIVEGDNPVDTEVHLPYVDAGATARDNYDGASAITAAIQASDNLNLHIVGPYTVTYQVTDLNNNIAQAKTRTVNVVDTTKPILSLNGFPSVDVEVHGTYQDAGASASDNYDDDALLTAKIVASDNIKLDTVAPYSVTYKVSDMASNAAVSIKRVVNVVDTTKPILSLTGEAEIFMDQGDAYLDAGATASDNYDSAGVITAAIQLTNPLKNDEIGRYTLKYTVTDLNGNEADPIERIIHVVHPLAVSSGEAEKVGTTQATFTGAIDHLGVKAVLEHGFVFNENEKKVNLQEAQGVLKLGKATSAAGFKTTVELSPGTSYYVRAYAVKEEGVVYGDLVKVVTSMLPSRPLATQTFGDTSIHRLNPDLLKGRIQTDESGVTSLAIESEGETRTHQFQLPLSAIDQINGRAGLDDGKPMVKIETKIGSMNLPTGELGSPSLISEDFTGDAASARLHVTIEKVDEEKRKAMEEASGIVGLVAPMKFDLSLKVDHMIDEKTSRVETTPIAELDHVVGRSIAAPETDLPLMAMTFDEEAQEWVPVLSRTVVDENGKKRVEILHREMGTYTLVERKPVEVLGLEGSDAKESIESLVSMGVLPYEAGSEYQANIGITRAEMAYTMIRLMGITQSQADALNYPDVEKHRYEREIKLATQVGIFTGYGDGSFRGDQIITREELAAVVERAVEYVEMTAGLDETKAHQFNDAHLIGFWSIDSIGRLTDAQVIEAEEGDHYRPQDQAKKSEAAIMLMNFLNLLDMK
ncbi:hypothetical protein SANA_28410 [Gottschalkiaceae bacterium SANA]|nr:hypothetical protein SANA_28410 [Gottschalkiaceae bacterium SANA]